MAMTEFEYLDNVIPELKFLLTNIARNEQMKDINQKESRTKDNSFSSEDVASTVVNIERSDNSITASISTNENNISSVWKSNFYTIARTLLPLELKDQIMQNLDSLVRPQIQNIIADLSGGVS